VIKCVDSDSNQAPSELHRRDSSRKLQLLFFYLHSASRGSISLKTLRGSLSASISKAKFFIVYMFLSVFFHKNVS